MKHLFVLIFSLNLCFGDGFHIIDFFDGKDAFDKDFFEKVIEMSEKELSLVEFDDLSKSELRVFTFLHDAKFGVFSKKEFFDALTLNQMLSKNSPEIYWSKVLRSEVFNFKDFSSKKFYNLQKIYSRFYRSMEKDFLTKKVSIYDLDSLNPTRGERVLKWFLLLPMMDFGLEYLKPFLRFSLVETEIGKQLLGSFSKGKIENFQKMKIDFLGKFLGLTLFSKLSYEESIKAKAYLKAILTLGSLSVQFPTKEKTLKKLRSSLLNQLDQVKRKKSDYDIDYFQLLVWGRSELRENFSIGPGFFSQMKLKENIEQINQSFTSDEFVRFLNWVREHSLTPHNQELVNIEGMNLILKGGGEFLELFDKLIERELLIDHGTLVEETINMKISDKLRIPLGLSRESFVEKRIQGSKKLKFLKDEYQKAFFELSNEKDQAALGGWIKKIDRLSQKMKKLEFEEEESLKMLLSVFEELMETQELKIQKFSKYIGEIEKNISSRKVRFLFELRLVSLLHMRPFKDPTEFFLIQKRAKYRQFFLSFMDKVNQYRDLISKDSNIISAQFFSCITSLSKVFINLPSGVRSYFFHENERSFDQILEIIFSVKDVHFVPGFPLAVRHFGIVFETESFPGDKINKALLKLFDYFENLPADWEKEMIEKYQRDFYQGVKDIGRILFSFDNYINYVSNSINSKHLVEVEDDLRKSEKKSLNIYELTSPSIRLSRKSVSHLNNFKFLERAFSLRNQLLNVLVKTSKDPLDLINISNLSGLSSLSLKGLHKNLELEIVMLNHGLGYEYFPAGIYSGRVFSDPKPGLDHRKVALFISFKLLSDSYNGSVVNLSRLNQLERKFPEVLRSFSYEFFKKNFVNYRQFERSIDDALDVYTHNNCSGFLN